MHDANELEAGMREELESADGGTSDQPASSNLYSQAVTSPGRNDLTNPHREEPGSTQPDSVPCQHCAAATIAKIGQVSQSLRRIETILTRTVQDLSLDIDLDDLDQIYHHKKSTRPRRQDNPLLPQSRGDDAYSLSPADEFWCFMGPGNEYNRMDRLRNEFIHFFSDSYGRLRRKECERAKRIPPRYFSGTMVIDEEPGTMSDEKIIDLVSNEWWPEGFDRPFHPPAKLQEFTTNSTSVSVYQASCDDCGFVEYSVAGDNVSSLFCTLTYNELKTPADVFNAMAAIMSCMSPKRIDHLIGETPRPVLDAVQQFLECWPSRLLTTSRFELGRFYCPTTIVLAFSLRSFSKRQPGWEGNPVLKPCRAKATLTGSIVLDEHRWCIVLFTTVFRPSSVKPLFSLLALSDSDYSRALRLLDAEKRWPQLHLTPTVCHTGMTAFQWLIIESLIEWSSKWEAFLDILDEHNESQTGDILSAQDRRVAMFDNENFDKSESYFATSQLLRVASGWIKYATSDLEALIKAYHGSYEKKCVRFLNEWQIQDDAERRQLKIVDKNWKCVRANLAVRSKFLLERIQRKELEIESLRNGLFNATSVAEAQKSSQVSHYILVFTVITIVYLPLGFISSLFALNMFDFQDPSTKTAFITTCATVGVVTYLFSFSLAWFVRKEERREKLKSLLPFALPASVFPARRPEMAGRNDAGRERQNKSNKGKGRENSPYIQEGHTDQVQGGSVLRERAHQGMDRVRSVFQKTGDSERPGLAVGDEERNDQDIEMGMW
ncbi:hypothetical protein QBC37DRAFT_391041 [Rhypophila decipiens]|uniref:Uncharacterized protein n=1 Tax=Rhypophila decipiens TaxID=261697 RepID=A0AAN6Y0D6_9PEZI|nr:hypothetical protein QBC37DRAFT_391041 [Rhypophila decipiens]